MSPGRIWHPPGQLSTPPAYIDRQAGTVGASTAAWGSLQPSRYTLKIASIGFPHKIGSNGMFYAKTLYLKYTRGGTGCLYCCSHQKMGSLLAQICYRETFSWVAVRDATSYPKFCFRAAALDSHPPPIVFLNLLNGLNARQRQAPQAGSNKAIYGHLKGRGHDMHQYKLTRLVANVVGECIFEQFIFIYLHLWHIM